MTEDSHSSIAQRSIETQTRVETTKSVPSFAETQILSVYYPEKLPPVRSTSDTCIFLDQQDRHPIRFRTSYDPLAIEKSTQTTMADSPSSSSTSSVNTVIARENPSTNSNERLSSWPPVPDEVLLDGQRPSRVQFAEQLINIIPPAPPMTQSKWVKNRLEKSDIRPNPGRVSHLRSVFEQSSDSSSPSSPMQLRAKEDPEEKPSTYGDQIRFRIQTNEQIKVTEKTMTVNKTTVEPLTWEALLGLPAEPTKKFVSTMTIPPPLPKRSESQVTIGESGYHSGDDQTRARAKPTTDIDPFSFPSFIDDYFSSHARHLCAADETLVVLIDEQQVPFPEIRIPSHQEHLSLPKNLYSNVINAFPRPFQTELDELIVFLHDELIVIPPSRWTEYRKKYHQAPWVEQLPKINREIPSQLIPHVEQWLTSHTEFPTGKEQFSIDGVAVPLLGRHGHLIRNLAENSSNQTHFVHELFNYLLRLGFVSYQSSKKIISIVHSELDVRLLLSTPSTESIEQLIQFLSTLDQIRFHPVNGSLILNETLIIPKEYAECLVKNEEKNIDYYELARLLLRLCDVEENRVDGTMILTFEGKKLILIDQRRLCREKLIEALQNSESEWIEGEEKRLTMLFNPSSFLQFDEHDSKMLVDDLHGLIPHCADYLINQAFDRIQYDPNERTLIISYHLQNLRLASRTGNNARSSRTKLIIATKQFFDPHHREVLLAWLERCQDQGSIVIAETNDILIKSFVIHHDDVQHYMASRSSRITLTDIAEILHRYRYIQSSTDQLQIGDEILSLERRKSSGVVDEEKTTLIDEFVEFLNDHDGIHYNNQTRRLILENPSDQSQLILSEDDSQWIKENQYRRRDVKDLLLRRAQLQQDEYHNWFLHYDDQWIPISLPKKRTGTTDTDNLQLLFPFNPSLRLIEKTASNSTLDIPLSNRTTVDPLLTLANYIYRVATIYQDESARLVIKMQEHEIVVPQQNAINAIQSINTAPQRTGTVIAKLIGQIGEVKSNGREGLIIRIGNSSFEIPKESIRGTESRTRRPVKTTPLPLLRQSKSASNLLSSPSETRQTLYSKDGRGDPRYLNLDYRSYPERNPQRSVSIDNLTRSDSYTLSQQHSSSNENLRSTSSLLKPQLIIVPPDPSISNVDEQTRFYLQYIYEKDAPMQDDSSGLMVLPSRYPIQPTQPQLIAPDHYRDQTLRNASVCVQQIDGEKIFYENLAQYLASDQPLISSWTVRRMLRFSSNNEYFNYLIKAMSPELAEHFVRTSQLSAINHSAENLSSTRIGRYNLRTGQRQRRDPSPSSSSLDSDMIIVNALAPRPGSTTAQRNLTRPLFRNRIEYES